MVLFDPSVIDYIHVKAQRVLVAGHKGASFSKYPVQRLDTYWLDEFLRETRCGIHLDYVEIYVAD